MQHVEGWCAQGRNAAGNDATIPLSLHIGSCREDAAAMPCHCL